MQKQQISVNRQMTQLEVEETLEAWAVQHDAVLRPMGRLVRRYKTEGENMHWHISAKGKGMGTVEVSYTPSNGRLTVLVHDNRRGTWAGQAYEDLAEEIKERKKCGVSKPRPKRTIR